MNEIFADLLDICVVVYLDDILIYSNDPSSHQDHVKEVLRHLHQHNLFVREDKCEFHRGSVEFLRYNLSPEGLTMSDEKVKAIQDWPKPRKVRDIQSFLGFANFYRRLIHDYSRITVPLTRLTRKGTPWHFSDECRRAFDTLKRLSLLLLY
jgi:Reverse transcriptase (RNA-dependent DNA polymerase)